MKIYQSSSPKNDIVEGAMTHHSRKVIYMDVGYVNTHYIQVIITSNLQSMDFFRNQNFKNLNQFNHFLQCAGATALTQRLMLSLYSF